MLANARPNALLALASYAVALADACPAALLAPASLAVVLADARATALLAPARGLCGHFASLRLAALPLELLPFAAPSAPVITTFSHVLVVSRFVFAASPLATSFFDRFFIPSSPLPSPSSSSITGV